MNLGLRWRVLAAAVALAASSVGVVATTPAYAAPSRAVIVVEAGEDLYTRVVSFSGSVSGLQALELAGARPGTYGYAGQGVAVCSLFGVGNPVGKDCLGTADDPRYWSYWHIKGDGGGWSYSPSCACDTVVRDGDVEGWSFGYGKSPPLRHFCDVAACAPSTTAGSGASGDDPPLATASSPSAPSSAPSPTTSPSAAPSDASPDDPQPIAPSTASSAPDVEASRPTPGRRALDPGGLAAARSGDGDETGGDDAGSPTGVLVAIGLVGATTAVSLRMRRRRRSAG